MVNIVFDPIVRGSSLQLVFTLSDNENPNLDFTAADIRFVGKLSTTDEDSAALFDVAKGGNGLTTSGTHQEIVTINIDNVGASQRNFDMKVICELKLTIAGFEVCIGRGTLDVLASVVPA